MSRDWEFSEQGGAELFGDVCAACHQPDAKGAVGAGAYPPLTADKKLVSTEFMLTVLFRGLKGMPPVGDMMSDAQVADVINYVRTHFGNAYPGAVSAADVSVGEATGDPALTLRRHGLAISRRPIQRPCSAWPARGRRRPRRPPARAI